MRTKFAYQRFFFEAAIYLAFLIILTFGMFIFVVVFNVQIAAVYNSTYGSEDGFRLNNAIQSTHTLLIN